MLNDDLLSLTEKSNISINGSNTYVPKSKRRGTFQCSKCEKSYTFEFNMKRHMRNAHQKVGTLKNSSLNGDDYNTSTTEFIQNFYFKSNILVC